MSLFNYLSDIIQESNAIARKIVPLGCIMLNRSIKTVDKRTCLLRKGDKVKIEKGEIVDCYDSPTHEITQCFGTLVNTNFSVSVVDLKTNEVLTINL